ncbi:MAG: hypothetical protein H7222_12525 [Methylotenera sp.]|nr:hypothetical protein [Oligoflexia bacterium]
MTIAISGAKMQEIIGWASSFILLLTIGKQIYKQWSEKTSRGVSKWLYIGEILANAGFIIYSGMLHNYVFLVTNVLLLISSLVGLGIVIHHRKVEAPVEGEVESRVESRASKPSEQRVNVPAAPSHSDSSLSA